MTQEPGKRIVSKAEYLRLQGRKTFLWGEALLSIVYGLAYFGFGLWRLTQGIHGINIVTSLLFTGVALAFWSQARRQWPDKNAFPAVEPLTRANIAKLPATDSLVRASQEPLQAQETILLRAASEGAQKHEKELLRATTGGQEER